MASVARLALSSIGVEGTLAGPFSLMDQVLGATELLLSARERREKPFSPAYQPKSIEARLERGSPADVGRVETEPDAQDAHPELTESRRSEEAEEQAESRRSCPSNETALGHPRDGARGAESAGRGESKEAMPGRWMGGAQPAMGGGECCELESAMGEDDEPCLPSVKT